MRRIGIMCILFLLTATSLYCQNSYPKKILINSDTIVAITPIQLKQINSRLLELKDLRLYTQTLEEYNATQKNVIKHQIGLNRELNKKNTRLLINNSDLMKLNSTNDKLLGYYKKELKVQKRRKTLTFFGGLTIGVAATSIFMLTVHK